ncbi:hypothetical protein J5N58_12205 [Rhizobium cremeum]|nr:hypothetical protein [Rhizobium cremeum]MCJ8000438.1 hypothetical protein [Rhizobium cremeum]
MLVGAGSAREPRRDYRQRLYVGGECRRTGEAERLMGRNMDADTKYVNAESSSSYCFCITKFYLCLLRRVDFQTVTPEQGMNL